MISSQLRNFFLKIRIVEQKLFGVFVYCFHISNLNENIYLFIIEQKNRVNAKKNVILTLLKMTQTLLWNAFAVELYMVISFLIYN